MMLEDNKPCDHPGCLSHVTHPCEGCGRVAGKRRFDEVNCFCCGRILEAEQSDNPMDIYPVYGALVFRSYGNYGSTVFDPVPPRKGTELIQITVCDGCIKAKSKRVTRLHNIKRGSDSADSEVFVPFITPDDIDDLSENVCLILKNIDSNGRTNSFANKRDLHILPSVIALWHETCESHNYTNSDDLSNKLAWDVCVALYNYDRREDAVTRDECWVEIWKRFTMWKTK